MYECSDPFHPHWTYGPCMNDKRKTAFDLVESLICVNRERARCLALMPPSLVIWFMHEWQKKDCFWSSGVTNLCKQRENIVWHSCHPHWSYGPCMNDKRKTALVEWGHIEIYNEPGWIQKFVSLNRTSFQGGGLWQRIQVFLLCNTIYIYI